MKVRAASLDDLLHEVFRRLINQGDVTYPSKGKAYELTGAVLELSNPRARLSRTESRAVIFSWLGELLWYLSGSNQLAFVKYYIKDYKPDAPGLKVVGAAYGPRLCAKEDPQLKWAIALLRRKQDTRRAVIPIYLPSDADVTRPEVPCTCTLHFLMRGGRLDLITHMRSNDAFVGLPGDIFAFTMIQEIVASALNVKLGRYKHLVGSLHLYEKTARTRKLSLQRGFRKR